MESINVTAVVLAVVIGAIGPTLIFWAEMKSFKATTSIEIEAIKEDVKDLKLKVSIDNYTALNTKVAELSSITVVEMNHLKERINQLSNDVRNTSLRTGSNKKGLP